MKRINLPLMSTFHLATVTLLMGWLSGSASAQSSHEGVIDDWSSHHVIFSNPGTLEDAEKSGKGEQWRRIVTDPRYRAQWFKRNATPASAQATEASRSPNGNLSIADTRKRRPPQDDSLQGDWSLLLKTGGPGGVALDMYPAKYTFAPIGSPDCVNDFVVFPINGAGAGNQANILGANNLYVTGPGGAGTGLCAGTLPTVLFAYNVGPGAVLTSPTLSLDGTKVAFVESISGGISGGSIFHVLTIDKRGNAGCPSASPCNGASASSPAVPGANNAAVDMKVALNAAVTRSSPFVDYANDIAYVGDDTGVLHKITPVFGPGTPTQAGTPWPVPVASTVLSSPVFDGGASQNIFVGGSDGNLYCVTSGGTPCSNPSQPVAGGTAPFSPVLDSPIVDSTTQKVFAEASNSTNSVLMQLTTTFAPGSIVRATMGANGTDLYKGTFDNAYFANVSTGHMYFCGNLTTSATPTLWRVTFDSSGTMSGTNDGNQFQLVQSGQTGTGDDCTPLTEIFNTFQGKDLLFVGVNNHGFSTGLVNCGNRTCIMSFDITSGFPAAANATNPSPALGPAGISGIIIDNVSGANGASQIYFGNLQSLTGVQASQSTLQ